MAEADNVLKIERLNGQNYRTWSYNMKLVLMEKGLSGFINGDEVPPIASSPIATRSAFKARSERAYSQIALGVEKSLQVHIIGTTDPKEACEILEKQFNVVSVSQVVGLNKRF